MGHQDTREDDGQDGDAAQRPEEPPPFWEWVVAGIGALLLAGALAFLAQHALSGGGAEPPRPVIVVQDIVAQPGGWVVLLRVHNQARKTAADLRVSGVLTRAGMELERSETEFQYVPGHSSRDGGLFFRRDPREYRLDLRAESYQDP